MVHVFALTLMLFSVGAFNGRPAFFGDTPIYYSQGQYLATALGFPPLKITAQRRADPYSVMPGSLGFANRGAVAVAAARSPVYGLLLYVSERLGTLWLLVAVQALVVSFAVSLFIRSAARRNTVRIFYACGAVLALGTSLPFFTAFAMPDVFAGVNILATVLLTLFADRLSRIEKAALWALLCFGLAAHMSNLLTLIGLIACAAGVMVVSKEKPVWIAARCGALGLAVVAAVGLSAFCSKIYEHGTGVRQIAPPFLMARVLADGPGRAYLAAHCPDGAAPLLCRYKDRSFADEEEFLWSRKPAVGVYALLDYNTQTRLKREEIPFVLHAVAERPGQELGTMLRNWGGQLILFRLIEPLHNPAEFLTQKGWRATSAWRIVPGHDACERRPASCQPRLPLPALQAWQMMVMMAAGVLLVVVLASSDLRAAVAASDPNERREIRLALRATVLIVAAVILNAAVCGALSGPFPRYQTRLIWLLPLTGALLFQMLPWREALARMRMGGVRRKGLAPA